MGWENYLLITAAYSTGVYFAYRAGRSSGLRDGIHTTLDEIAAISNKSSSEISEMILENRYRRRALKSNGA